MIPALNIGETYQTVVERMSYGAAGVVRVHGMVVFVENVCPEDEIEIKVTSVKKNFATAVLQKILQPSSYRIKPPCPVVDTCGGCDWQNIQYEEQLKQKQAIVEFALRKFKTKIHPILASPKNFRYRNRIQVRLQNGALGFYQRHSNQLVAVDDCPITEDALIAEFAILKKEFSNSSQEEKVEIYRGADQKIYRSLNKEHGEELGFSQVNTEQNKVLIEKILNWFPPQTKSFFDLYCGSGNLTIPILQKFNSTSAIGVEFNASATQKAQSESVKLGLSHRLTVHTNRVESWLSKYAGSAPSLILLDPPRVGCDSLAIQKIASLQSPTILYVSCDLGTFSRDVERLCAQGSYELVEVQPLDMFPQTHHIELVAKVLLRH